MGWGAAAPTANRPRLRRLCVVLAAAPLALGLPAAGQASARTAPERAAVVLPLESGQGWYWDTRPEAIPCPEGAPAECNLIGDPAGRIAELFARDHLYVGWDSLQQAPEMITGLAFDLSPIDPGSRSPACAWRCSSTLRRPRRFPSRSPAHRR